MKISTAQVASVLFFTFALLLPQAVLAYTLDPVDINLANGATTDLKVYAKVTDGSNGLALDLEFSGLEVTNLTLPTGILSIGTCTGQKKFTANKVCVDLASTTAFNDGQLLATVSVRKTDSSPAIVTAVGDNKYSKGTKITGVVAQTGGITNSPSIDLGSSNMLAILVVAAFAILTLGVVAVAIRRMNTKPVTPVAPPMV